MQIIYMYKEVVKNETIKKALVVVCNNWHDD